MEGKTPLILIIDDDEQIRYTFRELCTFQGWKALTAHSYPQARQILQAQRPDVILVDYHLPVMDGIRVVKALRETHPQTPIIVLTMDEQETVMRSFMEAGADDFALKPVKALDFIARIQMHLKYAEQRKYYGDAQKGINPETMRRILAFLEQADGFVELEAIAENTSISGKSVYRYMQHLVRQGRVERQTDYGKVGRPRSAYRLAKGEPP